MRPFVAVAIQYRVQVADYASPETFAAAMRRRMEAVRSHFVTGLPILVAFPEDIGLGLVLTPDYSRVRDCATFAEAGGVLLRHHADTAATEQQHVGGSAVAALLKVMSEAHVERVYRETFSRLARDYGVYLSAGSAPIAPASDGGVYNISYLFGPDGALLRAERKTHLIETEEIAALGLLAGAEADLRAVSLPFGTVGTAICFDAFHASVLDRFAAQGADILLQPSFNTGPWTPEQAEEWETTGLWQALQTRPGLRAGINPMMVGSLFDVAGEGRSSIVAPCRYTPDGSGYLARASSATEEEIISAVIR